MFSNDLNSAYEYERERRNDERRAAADSQRAQGLSKSGIPLPLAAGVMVVVITLMYEL